jgi:hypothetical protein
MFLPSQQNSGAGDPKSKFWQARTVYLIMYIYVAINVQETQFIATPVSRGPHNILLLDTLSEQSRRNLTETGTKIHFANKHL